jgi:hypothetical protein
MEPTEVMNHVTIAVFHDTCGNLIQYNKRRKNKPFNWKNNSSAEFIQPRRELH